MTARQSVTTTTVQIVVAAVVSVMSLFGFIQFKGADWIVGKASPTARQDAFTSQTWRDEAKPWIENYVQVYVQSEIAKSMEEVRKEYMSVREELSEQKGRLQEIQATVTTFAAEGPRDVIKRLNDMQEGDKERTKLIMDQGVKLQLMQQQQQRQLRAPGW